jgi:hypothetical protein
MKYIIQKWEESERGWGCRPDGFSIHKNEIDRVNYIQTYNDSLPKEVPDEYSRICGTPYEAEISNKELEKLLKINGSKSEYKYGWRIWRGKYPGSGGKNGWVNRE